jgi:penicillin amidase
VRRPARLILRALSWLLLLAALALLAGWLALRASLPEVTGESRVAGLREPVRVERDAAGVPVIRGANRLDVARATGFVHAQERFFQMDLMRRAAAGELSALLGPALLETDRRLRIHRFRSRAERALEGVDPSQAQLLRAYAQGVNAGLEALTLRPFEYLVLRSRPQPWLPEDALLVVYSMWLDLQGGFPRQEMQQDRLHATLPEPVYRLVTLSPSNWDAALDGSQLATVPLPEPTDYDLRRLDASLFAGNGVDVAGTSPRAPVPDSPDSMLGSNNWALSGQRTRSGSALVANDMHLGLRVPNTWYRARLVATDADLDVTGVTLPGMPAVIAGSNRHVAWGFTNSYGDFQDLVIIEPVAGQAEAYMTPDGERRFERHEEIIEVAGGKPETLTVLDTMWGPLIGEDAQGRPLALAWTAHRAGAMNLRLASLESARDLDEAVDIAATAGMPAQNALIGDAAGRVAWVLAGRIPVRSGYDPQLPASWVTPGIGWNGWVPVDRQPAIKDPPGGAAWSANARVVGGEMLALIGDGGYAHGARSHEIREDLAGLSQATPIDFLPIHLDDRARYIEQWRGLLDAVLASGGPSRAEALQLVRLWSGHAAADDAGYRLLREFERAVTKRAFAMLTAEARARFPDFGWRPPSRFTDVAFRLAAERPANLLDPHYANWDAWLAAAADAAIESSGQGCETLAECTWGRANTTRIHHPLSSAVPLLSGLLDMPASEMPGDWSTPRVQSPVFGASERFAVEPGREQDGYFHMPGGQSGHPLSPFYRAGHEAWVKGEPTPFLPGPAKYVLTLTP